MADDPNDDKAIRKQIKRCRETHSAMKKAREAETARRVDYDAAAVAYKAAELAHNVVMTELIALLHGE